MGVIVFVFVCVDERCCECVTFENRSPYFYYNRCVYVFMWFYSRKNKSPKSLFSFSSFSFAYCYPQNVNKSIKIAYDFNELITFSFKISD